MSYSNFGKSLRVCNWSILICTFWRLVIFFYFLFHFNNTYILHPFVWNISPWLLTSFLWVFSVKHIYLKRQCMLFFFLCYDDFDQNDFFQFFPFVSEFHSFLKLFFYSKIICFCVSETCFHYIFNGWWTSTLSSYY